MVYTFVSVFNAGLIIRQLGCHIWFGTQSVAICCFAWYITRKSVHTQICSWKDIRTLRDSQVILWKQIAWSYSRQFLGGGSESLSQIRDNDNDNDNNNDKSSNTQILNGRKVTNIQGNGNICGESWGIECKKCEISLQNQAAGVIHLYWRELRKKMEINWGVQVWKNHGLWNFPKAIERKHTCIYTLY